ncbi:MAG: DUF2333 family protein [Hyphomonadaceae bacterium]|nr:DUF2333 family protein [Hyphomonadaceae bacterium]
MRHSLAAVKRAVTPNTQTAPVVNESAGPASADTTNPTPAKRNWKLIAVLGFIAILPFYYIIGAVATHRINDDLNFKAADAGAGTSKTVAVIAGLIDREVNDTAWSPNTQMFQPAAMLRYGGNMVNFQSGLIKALSTLTLEIDSQVGRTRGTSAADPDLGKARQGLSRQPDTWFVDSFWLTSSADQEYRKAEEALRAYNVRVGNGTAVFDVRVDNLQAVLNRVALDIGSSSDALEKQVTAGRKVLVDRRADKLFYFVKGQSYAYFITMRALREDFKDVIAERRVAPLYEAMLADLATAASMQPAIVQNASPEAMLMPNHLTTQGFYLLRARAKLREISDIIAR